MRFLTSNTNTKCNNLPYPLPELSLTLMVTDLKVKEYIWIKSDYLKMELTKLTL